MRAWTSIAVLALVCLTPASACADAGDDQYSVAAAHYSQGRWSLAIAEFETLLKNYPGHARTDKATFFLAEGLMQLGRYAEARARFDQFLALDPRSRFRRQAMFRAGEASYFAGKTDEARTSLKKFAEAYSTDALTAYALTYLGDIALNAGEPAEAATCYAQSLERFPTSPLADDCRLGEAKALSAAGEYDKAKPKLEAVIAGTSGSALHRAEARYQLGLNHFAQNQHADAVAQLTPLVELKEDAKLAAKARLACGQALQRSEKLDESQAMLAPLTTHAEHAAEAKLWIALSKKAAGDFAGASQDLVAAAESHPQHRLAPTTKFHAADALARQGRFTEARKILEKEGVGDEGQQPQRKYLLAIALQHQQEHTEALTLLGDLVETADGGLKIGALGAQAQSLIATDQFDSATKVLTSLIAAKGDAPGPRLFADLAVCHAKQKNWDAARAAFADLERRFPTEAITASTALILSELARQDKQEAWSRELLVRASGGRLTTPAPIAADSPPTAPQTPTAATATENANAAAATVPAVTALPASAKVASANGANETPAAPVAAPQPPVAASQAATSPGSTAPSTAAQPITLSTEDPYNAQNLAAQAAIANDKLAAGQAASEAVVAVQSADEKLAADKAAADKAAEKVAADLAAADATASAALFRLGWSQMQAGDHKAAAESLGSLIQRFPNHPQLGDALIMRARALEAEDQFDGALAVYAHLIERAAKNPTLEASTPAAHLASARILARLKQHTTAVKSYEHYLAGPAKDEVDSALYGLALSLAEMNRPEDSARALEQLHRDHADSRFWGDSTLRLAMFSLSGKDYVATATLLESLLEKSKDPVLLQRGLYLQAQLAVTAMKWGEVAPPLERLLKEHPESPLRLPAQYWLAESMYRQNKFVEAGQQYDALAKLAEGQNEAWLALVPLRRAQVRAQARQWDEARSIAADIQRKFPTFTQQFEVDYLLGRCHASQAEFDEARAAYARVISSPTGGKSETAAMAQWMIGESYFHQKNYEAAVREYLRLEILYPYPHWQAASLLQAGKCYDLLGQAKSAAEIYARLLKSYPNSEFSEEARQRSQIVPKHASTH